MNYWQKRLIESQDRLADKTVEETEAQLTRYYRRSMNKVIRDFESTYNHLLASVNAGREPTPADLYKLDAYWQLQGQIKNELTKLGDKQAALLSKKFMEEYIEVYNSISLPAGQAFATLSTEAAAQAINTIWCADGKTWSGRIWGNTEALMEELNNNLVDCVVAGRSTSDLKKQLMERFNVSYNKADSLVRTEIAHIQTQAAAQRYKDYGLNKYEFLGREAHEKELKCRCKELNGKVFNFAEMAEGKNAPPLHPRCRCAILPVVE